MVILKQGWDFKPLGVTQVSNEPKSPWKFQKRSLKDFPCGKPICWLNHWSLWSLFLLVNLYYLSPSLLVKSNYTVSFISGTRKPLRIWLEEIHFVVWSKPNTLKIHRSPHCWLAIPSIPLVSPGCSLVKFPWWLSHPTVTHVWCYIHCCFCFFSAVFPIS